MSKKSMLLGLAAGLLQIAAAHGAELEFSANPGVFDPGKTKSVTASWQQNQGLADDDKGAIQGTPGKGLVLTKNAPTATNAASGATIDGVSFITLTEIGWDVRRDGHCGAGAPRFNITTADGVTHFIGCNSPAPTTVVQVTPGAMGFDRRRYDPASAFPPVAPGSAVVSIEIIFDEGTDTPPNPGSVVIDNIDVNGVIIK